MAYSGGIGEPRLNFWLFAAFLVLVFLMGGASRPEALSQPLVRIVSVLALAFWAVQLSGAHLRAARAPILFLAVAAAIILIQLIPLPPGIWASIPGRQLFAEGMAAAALEPVWRPLSLTPDRSLDTLLSLLPPVAAAAGLMIVGRERYPDIMVLLLALFLVSLLVAVAQISTGSLYLYQITNERSAVGLFANRNHQALLLAMVLPLLAHLMTRLRDGRPGRQVRRVAIGLFMILVAPMILITGSRAGIVLGVVGGLLALALALWGKPLSGGSDRASLITILASLGLSVAALFATVFASRDLALDRLIGDWGEDETRAQNLGDYARMAADFMPFGSGAGSFDPIYRIYEPAALLRPNFLNHAHNDLAQLAIEYGVPGLALLAVFLLWWGWRSWRAWSPQRYGRPERVGSALVLLILIASIGDYPLRTPIHAVMLIIGVFFLHRLSSPQPNAPLEPGTASSKPPNGHREGAPAA